MITLKTIRIKKSQKWREILIEPRIKKYIIEKIKRVQINFFLKYLILNFSLKRLIEKIYFVVHSSATLLSQYFWIAFNIHKKLKKIQKKSK